jgi:hypothetical protein
LRNRVQGMTAAISDNTNVLSGRDRQTTTLIFAIAGPRRRGRRAAAALALARGALGAVGPQARILDEHSHAGERFGNDDKARVLAVWDGIPLGADQAEEACRAALACVRAVRLSGLTAASGRPLAVRVAIAGSGPFRLPDAVVAADRLLGAGARYGTAIVIAEEVRRLAGARIHARELGRLAARGGAGGAIYELVRAASDRGAGPSWIALYEAGLAAYRRRDWTGALSLLHMLLAIRGSDGPALLLIARCQRRLAAAGRTGRDSRRLSPP